MSINPPLDPGSIKLMNNPDRKHLNFHLDDSGKKVIASFAGGVEIKRVSQEDVIQFIREAGFGQYKIDHDQLSRIVSRYNSDTPFELPVAESIEGTYAITVDNNTLSAYLKVSLPQGGEPIQIENIFKEAKQKGIGLPLNLAAIQEALQKGAENVLIAQGKPPVHGINGAVENLIPCMGDRRPKLSPNGLADFRDFGDIVTVQAGDVLMRRTPPTEGTPGLALSGKEISARPGKEAVFAKKIRGAAIDPTNPNQLIALISGLPVQGINEISVEPVFKVKNVDLHSGNINFDGTVQVDNDVCAGMTIKATGDIYVNGTVEGALLEAGGNIVVKGGIIAVQEQGDHFTPSVNCSGDCSARFSQNARVSAKQGIFIAEFTMQSDLTAGHQIVVGKKGSSKGYIIGGNINAAMLVKALHIGSENGVRTLINSGGDPDLYERLHIANLEREAIERKLADVLRLIEISLHTPEKIPSETLKSAESTRDILKADLEEMASLESHLQTQVDLVNKAQVIAEKHIYSGVEIRLGNNKQKIIADREACYFYLQDGELICA